MDSGEQLKDDLRHGRIEAERLVDLLVSAQRQLHAMKQQLEQAHRRIEELEKGRGGAATAKVDAS